MIVAVKNKVSKDPEHNYTQAVCDRCRTPCSESRIPCRSGPSAREEAEKIALTHGYKEHMVRDNHPRKRKVSWTIELLCPGCAAAETIMEGMQA